MQFYVQKTSLSFNINFWKSFYYFFILFEKKQIIRQTQILDFYQTEVTLNDIGGLENLKDWLSLRFNSFSKKAQVYGIPFPRGILLTGVQGTGKSLMAKAIAHDWALPLLRLDIGKLFTGIVGESEASIRQAIQITEALSPCVLWIDEIDKSFSSTNSNLDNGTANRVFSTFLTWLSEKTSPVFFIATANNIEVLPPELLRKGRFDEIFFLNLPSQLEREKIFSVHLSRIRPNSVSDFDIPLVSARTANFSGAEIEQVIGWQSPEDVTKVLAWAAEQPPRASVVNRKSCIPSTIDEESNDG